jgi:hypothetical protein
VLNELNDTQFKETLVQPVYRILEKYKPDVRLDSYLHELNQKSTLLHNRSDFALLGIYGSDDQRHVHVILWYGVSDRCLVLVIDRERKSILGHHLLRLDDESGTAGIPWPIKRPVSGGPPVLYETDKIEEE